MLGFVINLLQTTAIIMFVFFFIYNSSLDKAFLLLHIHSDKQIHKHILQFSDTNQFDEIVLVE